ncbi:hypothetical protein B9Z19DRAFT_1061991 [Tuber borchii]|uniref:Uncharacterized protein n=1 Tax=Tuber borchii TaxID=42251 RepID=A0A2T6ZQH0_TUBBO|nr:hypothetical protein B9Z19DRAFT_141862 [Tuber borchii]PUU82305.1 hypothetical protein B9Z19DRAFT_1061991 [Tuber borchii]
MQSFSNLSTRPAPTPVWGPSSLYTPSPKSQKNDGGKTTDPGRPGHDYHGMALTDFARVVTVQMDELIATFKSYLEMKAKEVPAQYLPFAEAVGKAVKLYQKGDISKTDFRLAISSLKHNPLECVAFWKMSDELRIDWIIERAKEMERGAGNAEA